MSLGPPYARALAIPSYFSWGGVPEDRGLAPRIFRHFWFYAVKKKKYHVARPFANFNSLRCVNAAGGCDEPMEMDVPRDGCGPPAGLGGHHGREWDHVGQAMRKTCAMQCCRGSLGGGWTIGQARPVPPLG
jgi:hypothetical protein